MARSLRTCLWSLCSLVAVPVLAEADICQWTGAGASNLWSVAANWTACHAGGVPMNGDSVIIPDGAARSTSQNDMTGRILASISIIGRSVSGTGYTVTGNPLFLTNGVKFESNTVGARLENTLTLAGTQTFRNDGVEPAFITGAVALNGALVTLTAAGDIHLSGAVTGTGGISKVGSEILLLDGDGANTYTGLTHVNAGIVASRDVKALGATTPGNFTIVYSGATLAVESGTSTAEPIQLNGGALRSLATTGTFSGDIFVQNTNGTINAHTSSSALTLSGAISGPGTLTKVGPGDATLSGSGTFAGLLLVDGELFVDGNFSAVPTSLAVGVLGGTGQVGSLGGLGGTVGPGHSPGVLTTSNLMLNGSLTYAVELNGTTAGAGYDQLNAIGPVSVDGCVLAPTLGFAAPEGSTYTIVNNDGADPVDGVFAGLPEGATLTIGSSAFTITYHGGDGNDIVLARPVTHYTRYFAEGASNSFYATRIAVVNPNADTANVTLRLLGQNGLQTTIARAVGANQRTTFELTPGPALPDAVYSTVVESDRPVVADRLMSWDGTGYGSSLETSIAAPGTTWYLAEGATGAFSLYYLLQNPGDAAASVTVSYLLPGGHAPIVKVYPVAAHSRHTIDVAGEHADLAHAEVSAKIASTLPIVVERAMYTRSPSQFQAAGHAGAGQPSSATRWFVAEGATGFFDEFVLIANAEATSAAITVRYLLEGQPSFTESFTVAANSRYTLDLKRNPSLRATPVSVIVESTNAIPIVVERVMWWPSRQTWYEASLSAGVTGTGTRWAIAEGEQGGPFNSSTYVLIANTDPAVSGTATVKLLYEDGTTDQKTIDLPANGRKTVDASTFASAANRRFGVIVESNGVPIVVERSFFSSSGGQFWAAGATSVATNITP